MGVLYKKDGVQIVSTSNSFQTTINWLKEEIPGKIKENNIPGLSITLVTKDEVIFSQGFGYTDQDKAQEVNEDTLLGLQSTSKTFTAIGFLRAVQKGLVGIDDPLIMHYPEFAMKCRFENSQEEIKKITFRHLLSHSAGLVNETTVGGVFDDTDATFDEHIHSIENAWLEYPVGQRKSYANIGLDLVAYTLQRISGKPYPEYMKDAIIEHLGLFSLTFESRLAYKNPNSFKGHVGKR